MPQRSGGGGDGKDAKGQTDWSLRVLLAVTGVMGMVVAATIGHVLARTSVTWLIWCSVVVLALGMGWAWWKLTGWLLVCKRQQILHPRVKVKFDNLISRARMLRAGDAHRTGEARGPVNGAAPRLSISDAEESALLRAVRYENLRYCVKSEETLLCLKGLTPHFADTHVFEVQQTAEELSEVVETITEFCAINNGKVESAVGDRLFLSFNSKQRLVDAMCTAVYCTKLACSFQLTAGVARGAVVKGRVGSKIQSWVTLAGGTAHICDLLASAAVTFGCNVLFAGEIDNQVLFNYAFAQVDLVTFEKCPGGRCPIFSVTEGAGVDADISLMWVNVSRGDLDGASVLLEQLPEHQTSVVKMKARLKNLFAAIDKANADHYDVCCSPHPFLNVLENQIKRTNRLGQLSAGGAATERHAFLVLRLAGNPETPRKLREGMACFCMSVERCKGTVELLLSDRFIARWVIHNDEFDDVIACSERLLKVYDGWACGLGLAAGVGETVDHRDLAVVCSDARARAECLAMLSYKYGLETVADLCVVHKKKVVDTDAREAGVGSPTGPIHPPVHPSRHRRNAGDKVAAVDWRVITFDGTFFIPKMIPSAGLVELHRPSNVVYLRAMQQMGEKLWANARELFHQYMEIEEHDMWARELLSVVTSAAQQESVGTRRSDDPIHFVLDPSGGRFYLTDRQLREVEEANCPREGFGDAGGDANLAKPGGAAISARQRLAYSGSVDEFDARLQDRKTIRAYLGYHNLSESLVQKIDEQYSFHVLDLWTLAYFLFLSTDLVTTPAHAMELGDDVHHYDGPRLAWVILGYTCDVVAIGGIIRSLYEPYTTPQGNVITDKAAIRKHYLGSSLMYVDVASTFPWELFWLAADSRVLIKHPWVRANRMLKVFRWPSFVMKVQLRHFPDAHPVAVKLFIHLSLLIYILFFFGCCWDIAMSFDSVRDPVTGERVNSQAAYFGLDGYPEAYSASERILVAFHWACRGFAGYGQRWPTTDQMFVMSVINVVFGIAIFATVIAYLQSMRKMTHNEVFEARLDSVVQVAEHRHLDGSTVADILRYHRMLWAKTKQVYEGQFDAIRDELPEELVSELSFFANIRALENIEVLLNAKDPPFIAQMIANMSMRFGAPGEQLFSRGDAFKELGAGIYFIHKGTAVAMVEGHDIEVVRAGGYWGEISCLLGLPQAADFVVRTYCELYYLPMQGFRKVLRDFPAYTEVFVQSAARRREMIRGILASKQDDNEDTASSDNDSDGGSSHTTSASEEEIQSNVGHLDTQTLSRVRSSFCNKILDRRNSQMSLLQRASQVSRMSMGMSMAEDAPAVPQAVRD